MPRVAEGDGAARGAQPEAALGSAGVGPAAAARRRARTPTGARSTRSTSFSRSPARTSHAFVHGAARDPQPRRRPALAARRGRAGRADSGRRRRADGERALHAQAAAADAHLRRAADLRRSADRLGHDRPAVGARAVRSAVPARRRDLGEEGAERRPVRQRGAGHVLSGREEVQHHLGRRLGRHGAAARAARQARSRAGAADRRARASAASRRWRASSARS